MGTGHRGLCLSLATACRLVGGWFLVVTALQQATAAPQDATPVSAAIPAAGSQGQAENPGDEYIRPLNLFQLRYEYETAPGSGSEKGTISQVTSDIIRLRVDHRINLDPQWAVGLRADLPFLAKNPISSSNPAGNYLFGVGDADFQVALLHEFDARWAAGFGIFGVRYALSEIGPNSYLEPLVRYDVSFAGDPSKKNISNLQFAPTLHFGLPDHWFVTFYPSPDIRVNYGDPVTGQTGRLFLPFDIRIGRKLTEDTVLSLEVGVPIVKDYPVYTLKTEVRLNMSF